jgi:5-methyltetrahydrofolate--homocysteine methyltransferase
MADYGMEELAYEINVAAARLAREARTSSPAAARRPRTSRASSPACSGPTNRTASISPDVNDPGYAQHRLRQLVRAYAEATRGLIEGGATCLMVETVFDTLNAKAALFAIEQVFDEERRRTAGDDLRHHHRRSGRTLSGQTTEAFWNSPAPCAAPGRRRAELRLGRRGAAPLRGGAVRIAECLQCPPQRRPAERARRVRPEAREMAERRSATSPSVGFLNIVGGCCGTTPEHIRAIAEAWRAWRRAPARRSPGAAPVGPRAAATSDRDSLFVNVGERTNVTGSARFKR